MAKPTPQEIQDLRDAAKQEKAYNDASSTPPAPMPAPPASAPKRMAKGGSASSRADGCALRGKTRA
jgi:hypothetical protein